MEKQRTYAIEDILGAVLLIVALFALGFFNFKSDAPLVEAGLSAQAGQIVSESVHGMQVSIEGRDMTLSGLADSEAEKEAILAELREIEGRGKIRAQVTVLEPMVPFTFSATRAPDAPLVFDGGTPTETFRQKLAEAYGDGAGALVLAAGAPGESWPNVAESGLRALEELVSGRLELEDGALRLEGKALTPEVAARVELLLADLPEGYSASSTIEAIDDGSPLRLTAARSEGETIGVAAKLPDGMESAGLEGDIVLSPLPMPIDGWDEAVNRALDALEALHNGHLAIIGPNLTLSGEAWSEASHAAAEAALGEMPDGMVISTRILLADSGRPFGLHLTRNGHSVRAEGKVPQSLAPPVLAALVGGPVAAEALEVVRISPGESWWRAASLGTEAVKLLESGSVRFDGTTLTVEGRVQDPPAFARLKQHLEALPDGVALDLRASLIDDGTPLRLHLTHDGASAMLNGKLPEGWRADMLARWLGVPVLVEDMIGTPKPGPDGWDVAVEVSVKALAQFESGALALSGQDISLTGILRNPAREREMLAALDALPKGYQITTEISFQDDGRPFGFRLSYDGARGVLSGKVPSDLGPASQSAILGAPVIAGELNFAGVAADADWWSAARAGLKALAALQEGELELDAFQLKLTGQAATPRTEEAIRTRLAPFEDAFKITIEIETE